MVICLERGADLCMAQLMPLPLTVSCFSKIRIGFTFLVLAHLRSSGKRAVKRVLLLLLLAGKLQRRYTVSGELRQRFVFLDITISGSFMRYGDTVSWASGRASGM